MKTLLPYNRKLKDFSRSLRKSMTDVEKILWSKIRGKQLKGHQFYRQKIIGNYIVDFYCPKARLVIELDGSQHFEPQEQLKDSIRNQFLNALGMKVLRFNDAEIMENIDGVLDRILDYLSER